LLLMAVRVADDRPLEPERRIVGSVRGEQRKAVLDRKLMSGSVDEAAAGDLVAVEFLVDETEPRAVVRRAQQIEECAFHGRVRYVSRAWSPRSRRSDGTTSGHARELLKPIRRGPSSRAGSTRGIPNRPPT